MYNNSNHNWTFHRNNESNNSEFNEPLQEPVAFEGKKITVYFILVIYI